MNESINFDIKTIITDLIDLGITDDKKILKYIKERFAISYLDIALYLVPKIIAYNKLASGSPSGEYYLKIVKRYKSLLDLCMDLA